MPYSQYTLDQIAIQIGVLLDDTSERYWTRQEKYYAIWEALYCWGAVTNYWRARGTFNLTPAQPYYDLAATLPALRTRIWTLGQMVTEIQYQLLEAPSGILGSGMSAQVSIADILNAIQRARNQFVLDAKLPYTLHASFAAPATNGQVQFPQSSVFVHRAAWQDQFSGRWTNLWREDAWSIDKGNYLWTLEPGQPQFYSEAESAPLVMQLSPAPLNPGTLEAISVDSLLVDLTNPNSTFNVPDEWVHAIKYCALADLLNNESQLKDSAVRGKYAITRYRQAMDLIMLGRSMIRLLLNNVPLPIDSFQAIDAALPYWRNQTGQPMFAGVLYDFLAFAYPPDNAYGILADVVQSAPIPTAPTQSMPIGEEDIDHVIDYAVHWLTFKCGGTEFQDTFAVYDDFMSAAAARGRINAAKIRYLVPLFGQPQREDEARPDRLEEAKTNA